MLKLDEMHKQFTSVNSVLLAEGGFKERYDLQEWIWNSPDAFFDELDEDLLVLGKEVPPSTEVLDHIDLLAVDKHGCSVIIELKRGSNKWQLSQGLSYAAMFSRWSRGTDFLEQLRVVSPQSCHITDETVKKYLEVPLDELNNSQRVLLVAESYDYELLITAQWLLDVYSLPVTCCQISLSQDSNGVYYLTSTTIVPPFEPSDVITHRYPTSPKGKTKTLEDGLLGCDNKDMVEFFKLRLAATQEINSHRDALVYRSGSTIRWYVQPRGERVKVTQLGRFTTQCGQHDNDYWKTNLAEPEIGYYKGNAAMRFYLRQKPDIAFFEKTTTDSAQFTWHQRMPASSDDTIAHGATV